ncbi:Uncharacterised protein [Mycobacteroides abscessus subsp. abscessus]|uniref:Uncharacterized protein n=1 Tax=Gordonia jacobaea TaxID=122202 RepID=A0ABR5IDC6_9ACTN|nr:hypothetical protein ABW18_11080 [Gordonia jacobaea]SKX67099.1 Uncharacterised protein [Mycobacteroides abscessus subsp. abscessus]
MLTLVELTRARALPSTHHRVGLPAGVALSSVRTLPIPGWTGRFREGTGQRLRARLKDHVATEPEHPAPVVTLGPASRDHDAAHGAASATDANSTVAQQQSPDVSTWWKVIAVASLVTG